MVDSVNGLIVIDFANFGNLGMFGDTVIVSSRYSGFITWLSRVDMLYLEDLRLTIKQAQLFFHLIQST